LWESQLQLRWRNLLLERRKSSSTVVRPFSSADPEAMVTYMHERHPILNTSIAPKLLPTRAQLDSNAPTGTGVQLNLTHKTSTRTRVTVSWMPGATVKRVQKEGEVPEKEAGFRHLHHF